MTPPRLLVAEARASSGEQRISLVLDGCELHLAIPVDALIGLVSVENMLTGLRGAAHCDAILLVNMYSDGRKKCGVAIEAGSHRPSEPGLEKKLDKCLDTAHAATAAAYKTLAAGSQPAAPKLRLYLGKLLVIRIRSSHLAGKLAAHTSARVVSCGSTVSHQDLVAACQAGRRVDTEPAAPNTG
ncbi:hypothetical protein [Pyrodictium abyssi]|uniref:Uncharacterized protein n=1 Tax=Pyrodictium abyssi TaxID=54256 RepID=A0ABM8IVU7_9CREN|nr:hypothetical protein PABY_12520 [Pyrodictium abyssi]